jgi:copper(I)-binding protein
VEVMSGDTTVAQAPIDVKREWVADAYQSAPGAQTAGFRLTIEGEGKGEDELLVRAVLEDGTRLPIGTIRAKVLRQRWFHAIRRG